MTRTLPSGKTRLLLVEGKEDQEFFIQLGRQLTSTDTWPIQINQYGGRSELADYLMGLTRLANFTQLEAIGIVRDADFSTDAFQSVQNAIRLTVESDSPHSLPLPSRVMEMSSGRPAVSVFIMPSADRDGMIEDLIVDPLGDDPVMQCVDAYIDCLTEAGLAVARHRLPKARLRAFITGKNVSEQATSDDSDKLYMSDVFSMSWWRDSNLWASPAFDDSKAFLRQLLA